MKYKLIVLAVAQQEFSEAITYYNDISHELAIKFLDLIETIFKKLEEHPEYYSFFQNSNSIRSLSLETFPYTIIFQIDNERVIIGAVFNTHQDPLKATNRF
jgi:plasmid stabilization system protein ParE